MVQFSEIPRHNQMEILKKMDFKDFIRFKKCSQETVEMTKNFNHKLSLDVRVMEMRVGIMILENLLLTGKEFDSLLNEPVRIETDSFHVLTKHSDPNRIHLEDLVGKIITRADHLFFDVDDLTEQMNLNNLLKILKVRKLNTYFLIDLSDILRQPEIKKLEEIHIYGSEIEEPAFLLLETSVISFSKGSGMTLATINKFLKQWVEGTRRIEKLVIRPIPIDRHLEIFDGLEFLTENAPRNEMDRILVHHFYSLSREDGKKLFVSIDRYEAQTRLLACEYDDLSSFVRSEYQWAIM